MCTCRRTPKELVWTDSRWKCVYVRVCARVCAAHTSRTKFFSQHEHVCFESGCWMVGAVSLSPLAPHSRTSCQVKLARSCLMFTDICFECLLRFKLNRREACSYRNCKLFRDG